MMFMAYHHGMIKEYLIKSDKPIVEYVTDDWMIL